MVCGDSRRDLFYSVQTPLVSESSKQQESDDENLFINKDAPKQSSK